MYTAVTPRHRYIIRWDLLDAPFDEDPFGFIELSDDDSRENIEFFAHKT